MPADRESLQAELARLDGNPHSVVIWFIPTALGQDL
jgi:hypothetical protein